MNAIYSVTLKSSSWGSTSLVFDVPLEHLVGHIPAGCDEVPSRPKMSTPELAVELSEVPHQSVQAPPLDGVHHPARCHRRGHAQQQMHMIGSDVPLQNLDVVRLAYLSHQIPHCQRHLSPQDRLAVLWDEHELVVALVDRVRTLPVRLRHLPKVRQASSRRRLKARGFTHLSPSEACVARPPREPLSGRPGSETGLPCFKSPLAYVLRPLPPRTGRPSRVGLSDRPRRPSSNERRVGLCIQPFGACSGFTRVAARTCNPPMADLCPGGLRRGSRPSRLPGSYEDVPTPPSTGLSPAALTQLSRHTLILDDGSHVELRERVGLTPVPRLRTAHPLGRTALRGH